MCRQRLFTGMGAFSFAGAQTIDFRPAEPAHKSLLFNGALSGANPSWVVTCNGTRDEGAVIEPVAAGLRFRKIRRTAIFFR